MTKAEAVAAEIKRRAQGPDHMARDGVTWTDLARMLEATERWAARSADPLGESRRILPVVLIAYYNPGWVPEGVPPPVHPWS